jgi:uncharacterized membrane protein
MSNAGTWLSITLPMKEKSQSRAYFYALFVVLFWGTSATAFKIGLRYIDPIQLLFWSSLSSTAILFTILVFQKKLNLLKFSGRKEILLSLAESLLNPFLYLLVLFKLIAFYQSSCSTPKLHLAIDLVVMAALLLKHPCILPML